jgi:transcriptional regulator with XRE-family HTH domain
MAGAPLVDPRFRAQLRDLRRQRGLSLRACGTLTHTSHTYLWELETGRKQPTMGLVAALDAALGAGGELARLVAETGAPLTPDDDARLAAAVRGEHRIDAADLEQLAAGLAGLRRREDLVGSAAVLPAADRHLSAVATLLATAPDPLRRSVFDLAGQHAQFSGWLHIAAGRYDRAARRFDRALEWATIAGSRDLTATTLSFKGHLAWQRGEVGLTRALTGAALGDPGIYPGQRAYDVLQEARCLALADDAAAVAGRLAESADLAAAEADFAGEAPPWQYYRGAAFYALERGTVYRYLGRSRPRCNALAIEEITGGVAALPVEMRQAEWAGDYLCQLVLAYRQAGDHAGADATVRRVRDLATRSGSTRLAAWLERVSHAEG